MSLEYYWIDLEGVINYCDSAEEAEREAEAQIDDARDEAADGWPEAVNCIEWGIVCAEARVVSRRKSEVEGFDEIVDYGLRGTELRDLPSQLDRQVVRDRDDALRTLALVAAALGVDLQALIEDPSIASALRADAEKWRALGSSTSCSHECPVLCAGARVSDRVEE